MFKYLTLSIITLIVYFVFINDVQFTNKSIGTVFVLSILVCFFIFLLFKFGLHYKIKALNNFALSFYYSVFEYKKYQKVPTNLSFLDSYKEQAEVALAANFDHSVSAATLKMSAPLYAVKDHFVDNLRAKIQEAERIKVEARKLNGKADKLLKETNDELVENNIVKKTPTRGLDGLFKIEHGVGHIIDLTAGELKEQSYNHTPDYAIITHIAIDNNPFLSSVYKYFKSDDVAALLHRAPFMIILVGIIGTFAGFYLALAAGGDIKSGASVAIVSSLVGIPVSLAMDYINTLFPDTIRYKQAFNSYKLSLELLFNHEKELEDTRRDRRKSDRA